MALARRRARAQESDGRQLRRLLRARRERPRRRAAEQRDELAPLHSITSSASGEQLGGTFEAERLGGLEVDHELELGRLHDRQVGRLLALENPAGIDAGLTIGVGDAGSVAHQAAGFGKLAQGIDRGHRYGGPPARRVCSRRVFKNGPAPTSSAPAPRWTRLAKAVSMSRSLLASRTSSCCPMAAPPPARLEQSARVGAYLGSTSTAMRRGSRHATHATAQAASPQVRAEMKLTPVTLPPGRLRLATRPSLTGSPPVAKTIGIVVVAALAASAEGVSAARSRPPAGEPRSAASAGSRSY